MTSKAFGKSSRLLNASDFQKVFDNPPFRASHKHFLILARHNGLAHSRVGLVIAKKNIRLAVNRNLIKRLIRESFRASQQNLGGIDAIVLARRGMDALENPFLRQQLDKQWLKLGRKASIKEETIKEGSAEP